MTTDNLMIVMKKHKIVITNLILMSNVVLIMFAFAHQYLYEKLA